MQAFSHANNRTAPAATRGSLPSCRCGLATGPAMTPYVADPSRRIRRAQRLRQRRDGLRRRARASRAEVGAPIRSGPSSAALPRDMTPANGHFARGMKTRRGVRQLTDLAVRRSPDPAIRHRPDLATAGLTDTLPDLWSLRLPVRSDRTRNRTPQRRRQGASGSGHLTPET
jgi:hypothetical protein